MIVPSLRIGLYGWWTLGCGIWIQISVIFIDFVDQIKSSHLYLDLALTGFFSLHKSILKESHTPTRLWFACFQVSPIVWAFISLKVALLSVESTSLHHKGWGEARQWKGLDVDQRKQDMRLIKWSSPSVSGPKILIVVYHANLSNKIKLWLMFGTV